MILAAFALLQGAVDPMDVTGVWYTQERESQVEVARSEGTVRGEIIWYEGIAEERVFDRENPDPAERGRELLGLPILDGFKPGDGKWRRGTIYDPTTGKSYRSAIHRTDSDTLAVEGCVAFICRTQEWQRVPAGEVRRPDGPMAVGER